MKHASEGIHPDSILPIVDISAAQSSAQTFIHSAILVIDISNNVWYNQTHWLIRAPYLSTIASNVETQGIHLQKSKQG